MVILLFALSLMMTNCSDDDRAGGQSLFVPSKITIAHVNADRTDELFFSYNTANQIIQIESISTEGNSTSKNMTSFEYNNDGLLSKASTQYVDTGFIIQLDFFYNAENTIVGIDYFHEQNVISEELGVTFDDDKNQYTVDVLSAVFTGPRDFVFDDLGQLYQYQQFGAGDFWTFTYNPDEKGVFADVNTQPALHIWGQLLFPTGSNRYFFAKKTIINYTRPGEAIESYYDNQVYDANGNLVDYEQYYYDFDMEIYKLATETKVEY